MRIAIIYSFEKPSWVSCQTIVSNLKLSYQEIFHESELLFCDFHSNIDEDKILELAQKIFKYSADKIIFIDHLPHPIELLASMDKMYGTCHRPELIFHVFGNFTLNISSWLNLDNILKKHKVKFICASRKQQLLVRKFIKNATTVYECPFPVDTKVFFFDKNLRVKVRNELNIKTSEHVFLYTGRISYQKKVVDVVQAFANILKHFGTNARLCIAGEFDNLGVPFLNKEIKINRYFQHVESVLSCFDKVIRDKIVYLGNLNANELNEIYNASDTFISMSVHNDEDFGMSPIESLCTGTQAILTNWGGYSSFYVDEIPSCIDYVPVSINASSVDINKSILLANILKQCNSLLVFDEKRSMMSELYKSKFSIFAISEIIKSIVNVVSSNEFEGFSDLMSKIPLQISDQSLPFFSDGRNYNSFYKELYESYV